MRESQLQVIVLKRPSLKQDVIMSKLGAFSVRNISAAVCLFAVAAVPARSQTNLKYQQPPKAISDIVNATPTPGILLGPAVAGEKRWILIEHFAGLPTITELAQPELRLA